MDFRKDIWVKIIAENGEKLAMIDARISSLLINTDWGKDENICRMTEEFNNVSEKLFFSAEKVCYDDVLWAVSKFTYISAYTKKIGRPKLWDGEKPDWVDEVNDLKRDIHKLYRQLFSQYTKTMRIYNSGSYSSGIYSN